MYTCYDKYIDKSYIHTNIHTYILTYIYTYIPDTREITTKEGGMEEEEEEEGENRSSFGEGWRDGGREAEEGRARWRSIGVGGRNGWR